MSILDKRKMERYPMAISAYLTFNAAQNEKAIEHVTRDICAGGAFFHASRSFPVGTDVQVDLVLPNRVRVKVDGAVIRSTQNGMAICFDNKYKIIPSQN